MRAGADAFVAKGDDVADMLLVQLDRLLVSAR
jgi:hypothetical protein